MPYKNKEDHRKNQRERNARNRAYYLSNKSCVVCGTVENLQIDHIDPEQKISHRIWSWSPLKRAEELAKCQVLCHTHHVEKTNSQRPALTHGRPYMYQKFKCRCDLCRKWKRESDAKYRK